MPDGKLSPATFSPISRAAEAAAAKAREAGLSVPKMREEQLLVAGNLWHQQLPEGEIFLANTPLSIYVLDG